MQHLNVQVKEWLQGFNQTVWHSRRGDRSALQWLMIRLVRTAVTAVRDFARHHGALRASALTFFTLLSLVPVAAMAFGIAKGFGFERRLQQELLESFSAQQEVVQQIIGFAQNLLNNTKGGMIAGIGVVVLFWSAIKVLSNIEGSFNHIWGVRSRPLVRKLSDYLTIILICPLLMVLSSSLTVFITHQVSAISGRFELLQMVGPVIYVMLKLLPFTLIWVLFTVIYIIMPNTRVRFDGALLAGVIAGTAYQAVQAAYIHFQIIVAKYNAIYGSFAALPLFLMWLQISWFIVIIGAEISHAYQLSEHGHPTAGGWELSYAETQLACLAICRYVIVRFHKGEPAMPAEQIADALAIPQALVDRLIGFLIKGNILVYTEASGNEPPAVQPAQDIARLTVSRVLSVLADVNSDSRHLARMPEARRFEATLTQLRHELEQASANKLIMDI